ncbi:MAG: amino acid adenylation domain-containing protein, partial [Deltaproteobacteria bacterium]|nr:amino acid adenylation domain-containing protein [Deltaproteobacteria bacterium]
VIADGGVTTLWLTAGLFHQMVEGHLDSLRGVRQLLAGGDALSLSHVRQALEELGPETRIINGYGPTESTTFASTHDAASRGLVTSVPIGRPISNTQTYVLDGHGEACPVGVPGELHLGGDGLARGYHQRPGLTAERFVPSPLALLPGGEGDRLRADSMAAGLRLYRTGDRARWLADGVLEFLGRDDGQVKIRGYRIEIGEVEAALAGHHQMAQVVVVVRGEGADKALVAYGVPQPGAEVVDGELRSYLKGRLPEYLVPNRFVLLEELPLTENGKVDRRALPDPDLVRGADESTYVAPTTATETALAQLWAELLGHEQVGLTDDFFELGGHSLLATQVISGVRQRFDVEVPLMLLFEEPTVAALAAHVEGEGVSGSGDSAPPLVASGEPGPYPLSFAQQRLWFIDQMAPATPAYNVPFAVGLSGSLDLAALEASLAAVVRRHDALRTTFHPGDEGPVQTVSPMDHWQLPLVDLEGHPEAADEVRRLSIREGMTPFDLARGPLLRVRLLRRGEGEYVLLLTLHHIVSDGWSIGVFTRELSQLYGAFLKQEPSALPSLSVQYTDFSRWQRQWFQGEVEERQLSYWRDRLGVSPEPLELPFDRPRPPQQSFAGANRVLRLPKDLGERLEVATGEAGGTLFMTLLAVFQMFLARVTGRQRIVVGSPIANRNRAETEPLIGFFVNTLALSTDLEGNPLVSDVLERVRRETLEAYQHQDLPFERLVEELEPRRDASRPALVQVSFAVQNAAANLLQLPGVEVSAGEVGFPVAKFDLTLAVVDGPNGLMAEFNYNTDLFDGSTIDRLSQAWRVLMEGVLAAPGDRLSTLPVLTSSQQAQLLGEWNDTTTAYPAEACIDQLFALQVQRDPEAIAILAGDRTWSYGELDRRSNQVARALVEVGVGPESMVGLCVERSPEMVAAVLGVAKAGGSYLPLDPEYPEERLAFMLADGAVAAVVLGEGQTEALPPCPAPQLILPEIFDQQGEAPLRPHGGSADNLFYVMYTSGSTGKPKGVAVTHRAVSRLVLETNYVDLGPEDRVPQLATSSFDGITFELWGPLLNGGGVVIVPRPVALDPDRFADLLEESSVTAMFITTALFNQLVQQAPRAFSKLRYLFFGGETADPRWVRKARAVEGLERLTHVYGPTESTTFSTAFSVHEVPADSLRVPIGGPISNTTGYVVDRRGSLVLPGASGELVLGGKGLARGYLGRPGLTAEKFVPDAFAREVGQRLYRTGDLVRQTAEGAVDFLGRVDRQVKLRGFRIELGEVETVLRSHPEV